MINFLHHQINTTKASKQPNNEPLTIFEALPLYTENEGEASLGDPADVEDGGGVETVEGAVSC